MTCRFKSDRFHAPEHYTAIEQPDLPTIDVPRPTMSTHTTLSNANISPDPSYLSQLSPADAAHYLDQWLHERQYSTKSVRRLLKQSCAQLDKEFLWSMISMQGISKRLLLHMFRIQTMRYENDLDELIRRMPQDTKYFNIAARACIDESQPELAEAIVQRMKQQGLSSDAATFNVFIRHQLKENKLDNALQLYHNMLSANISPNAATYNTFLQHICKRHIWEDLGLWLDRLEKYSKPTGITLRVLMGALYRFPDEAKLVDAFERTLTFVDTFDAKDMIHAGITALLRNNRSTHALSLLHRILATRVPLSTDLCNKLMHAFCQSDNLESAHALLQAMSSHSTESSALPPPDIVTFTIFIQARVRSSRTTDLESLSLLVKEMMSLGIHLNAKLQTTLLFAMVKSKFSNLAHARSLFQAMVDENDRWRFRWPGSTTERPWVTQIVMYNIMMDGYFLHHFYHRRRDTPREALELLHEAVDKHLGLTTSTLNIWVRGLAFFNRDFVAAERMIHWFTQRGVEMNERTVWYLVYSAYQYKDYDLARRWIRRLEQSGHTIRGKGLVYIKSKL